MTGLLARVRAVRLPRLRVDAASLLVASGAGLLVVAAAMTYLPAGVALLGLFLVAVGVGVMRS